MNGQVEVVNHQVEHHGDVGAARLKRRQPDAFDERRPVEHAAGGAHRAVESLDVAHGEHDVAARRCGEQVVRLGERHGERLLHQHGDAAVQALDADLVMTRRRHGDGHRLDVVAAVRRSW